MNFKPFSQIIGQDRAIEFLKRVIVKDRMPHAYLFTGIPGVGRTTTALALTQTLNCRQSMNGEGCGRCQSCRQIMNGHFVDLLSLHPDGQNIKIEQMRDLNHRLSFKPLSGNHRVSIIHQAEMMTLEAANSFLKTLEEPPPRNILILNVIEPLDLLPTIVSRCQRVPFNPLSVKLITEWLMNEKNVDEEKALVVAKLSEGSLGRSIYLYESGFLEKRQDYLVRLIQLPEFSSEQILKLALEYSGKEKKKDGGLSIKDTILFELLSMWKTWYRDLIIMKVNGPADLLINVDFSNKLKKMSKNFIMENLIDSLLVIDRAQRGLMENRNLDLMMENTVLTLKRLATPSK